MPVVTQFSVGLNNEVGALAKLCGHLKRAKVNIEAIALLTDGECGYVRLVATPPSAARAALSKGGYTFSTHEVLQLEVPHKSGALRGVATRLAKAGVNINYIYGSNPIGGTSSTLLISVSDIAEAIRLFEDYERNRENEEA